MGHLSNNEADEYHVGIIGPILKVLDATDSYFWSAVNHNVYTLLERLQACNQSMAAKTGM